MKALLVVDLQYDFLPGGSLAVTDGDKIIDVINDIQPNFDLIVATQDWHPANHKSFAVQHPTHQLFDVIDLNSIPQVLWPEHCVQGTKGAEFTSAWDNNKVAAIFRKGMNVEVDSYSGFYDNNKLSNTGLLGYLNDKNITELYICGLAAEFCVFFTAKDAKEAGIETYFLDFATKPITAEGLVQAKATMQELGINIIEDKKDLF
ncbi:bifunctional nicotinamidase/pyrazinamidase [Myroides phaeus]|uniref:nicotinamidase n=1 Tax=Myroides phaeus TaxID=702745 RepID=A0A1G8FT89_9FLAO|nr:bifunctional nicotinamidase/pyrazinamidase [Myroides phaeus]MEC4116437.1 bifunctional nicotinamidase/pyrazinamidase [Myroides phaeus]SDH85378.1 nicotinamidase/pyrazinamidase [Myroides phaeus]